MSVGFALPVVFLFLAFRLLRSGAGLRLGWRETWLYAAAITGVHLVATTEILNAFHTVTTGGVLFVWATGCLALLVVRTRIKPLPQASPFLPISFFKNVEPLEKALAFLMIMIAGLLAVVALYGVPNTYDSLTYHLARVAHWLQNRSVGIYATNCMYQNQHGPLAEWSILHLVLLQGNDRPANFVQWLSYVGCILAVSLIAEACGGTRRTGIIAAFFAATLPMALLQASTTQNDAVLSFWLLCTAYGCLKACREPAWPPLLFFGASLGLAMLTKALAYLYAPGFCVWLSVALWRRGFRFAAPRLAVVALLALALNGGYYLRNWTTTGTLLGLNEDSGPGYSYQNEIHTPAAITSNIVRNLALNAPQSPLLTHATESLVTRIHHILGLDPADPRLTTYARVFWMAPYPDETECASPLHLAAIALGFFLLFAARRRFTSQARLLALCVVTGAFLFCFLLKWQPFHTRLQLPLFFLALPAVAVVLDALKFRLLTFLLIGSMLAMAYPLILDSPNHSMLEQPNIFNSSASVQRYAFRPYVRAEFERTLELLRDSGATCVGVISPPNNSGWEYPLFDPDRMDFGYPWRVEQVGVRNCYAPLESPVPVDAVVNLYPGNAETCIVHGRLFHRALSGRFISLYLR